MYPWSFTLKPLSTESTTGRSNFSFFFWRTFCGTAWQISVFHCGVVCDIIFTSDSVILNSQCIWHAYYFLLLACKCFQVSYYNCCYYYFLEIMILWKLMGIKSVGRVALTWFAVGGTRLKLQNRLACLSATWIVHLNSYASSSMKSNLFHMYSLNKLKKQCRS